MDEFQVTAYYHMGLWVVGLKAYAHWQAEPTRAVVYKRWDMKEVESRDVADVLSQLLAEMSDRMAEDKYRASTPW